MQPDIRFQAVFEGRVQQLYLYITDRCGLRCEQCLYKTTLANREIRFEDAAQFVSLFGRWGARKLTFIGGEPLLYDRRNKNENLLRLCELAAVHGFEYVRIDTNGQQGVPNLLEDPRRSYISNLAVSLDGSSPSSNDVVRGQGTFAKAVRSIELAVEAGLYVTVTCCVHPGIKDGLKDYLSLCASLGVREVNFHPLFKMGIARDEFSGDTAIAPEEWMPLYRQLRAWEAEQRFGLVIRAPQRFVHRSDYEQAPHRYHYCPSLMGERALIHPDGAIRICALCIGTDLRVGTYDTVARRIRYVGDTSELSIGRMATSEPCMSQTADFGELVPLCISYKPYQAEYVWTSTHADRALGLT